MYILHGLKCFLTDSNVVSEKRIVSRVCHMFGSLNFKQRFNMSHLVGKPTMWFLNRSDTNRPVQAQKIARSLKFRI